MDSTPKAKSRKLSCINKSDNYESKINGSASPIFESPTNINSATSTPTIESKALPATDDYSPVFFLGTQESNEDVDVVWDWNSPQAKSKVVKKKQKRTLLPQYTKNPIKKHPSNNQLQTFDRIKEEMEALRDNVLNTNNIEDSCVVFDITCNNNEEIKGLIQQEHLDIEDDLDTYFNDDSIEEKLLLCSQEVESKIQTKHIQNIDSLLTCDVKKFTSSSSNVISKFCNLEENVASSNILGRSCSDTLVDKKSSSVSSPNICRSMSDPFHSVSNLSNQNLFDSSSFYNDDNKEKCQVSSVCNGKNAEKNSIENSFDRALVAFEEEDVELLSQMENNKYVSTLDETVMRQPKYEPKITSESKRNENNNSRPIPSYKNNNIPIVNNCKGSSNIKLDSKHILDEIEKKRMQALAKLEAKKKQDNTLFPRSKSVDTIESASSQTNYSLVEIELKRQQALAKLEAKKKQEIIEKNRLEALKRLEMNKRKRELLIKTSASRTDFTR